MKTINTIKIVTLTFIMALFFSSCEKDPDQTENSIQQGKTTILMTAISPDIFTRLQVRYNNVINAPIKVTVILQLADGQKKEVQVTIPANHKDLIQWDDNKFINAWNYNSFLDSTGNSPTPSIDHRWDISSVTIKAVSCPDKEYGFKVLTTNDWIFYEPKDPKTSVSFIVNKDTISYSDYDFIAALTQYKNGNSTYYFNFFSNKAMFFSDTKTYPLTNGITMNIPFMVFHNNGRNYGSSPDGPNAYSNGSTIRLTITNLTNTHFDATFSGKLWSLMQSDTLYISKGEIKNAKLPERVD